MATEPPQLPEAPWEAELVWHRWETPNGVLEIDMPERPTLTERPAPDDLVGGVYRFWSASTGRFTCTVTHLKLSAPQPDIVEEAYANLRRTFDQMGETQRHQQVEVDGRPGHELSTLLLIDERSEHVLLRAFVSPDELVLVQALASWPSETAAAQRCVRSLRIHEHASTGEDTLSPAPVATPADWHRWASPDGRAFADMPVPPERRPSRFPMPGGAGSATAWLSWANGRGCSTLVATFPADGPVPSPEESFDHVIDRAARGRYAHVVSDVTVFIGTYRGREAELQERRRQRGYVIRTVQAGRTLYFVQIMFESDEQRRELSPCLDSFRVLP